MFVLIATAAKLSWSCWPFKSGSFFSQVPMSHTSIAIRSSSSLRSGLLLLALPLDAAPGVSLSLPSLAFLSFFSFFALRSAASF